jgi:hypothetical protein
LSHHRRNNIASYLSIRYIRVIYTLVILAVQYGLYCLCVYVTIQKLGEDTVHIYIQSKHGLYFCEKKTFICKAYDKNKKNLIWLRKWKCTRLKTKKEKGELMKV